MIKRGLLFLVCYLMISCSGRNKTPDNIIGTKQMTEIIWNVLRAQALASEISHKDSTINVVAETKTLTQKVLNIHNVSSDEYNRSYNWYVKHPDIMQIIFDSLYNQKQRSDDFHNEKEYRSLRKDSLLKKHIKNE